MAAGRRMILAPLLVSAALCQALVAPVASAQLNACPAPRSRMTFGAPGYVDTTRAGGEPTVEMHPNGTLLYGAHAGTTLFYAPSAHDEQTAAFFRNYRGQAHYYWSANRGKSWHFSERTLPPRGVPASGFSDPELAVDKAGHVYISEINLANIAVSKSTDSGKTYELQNLFAMTLTDRQWMAADTRDVIYMTGDAVGGGTFPAAPIGSTGHVLVKSKDGGRTFGRPIPDPGGLGDVQVDKSNGTLYEAHYTTQGVLSISAFRGARRDRFRRENHVIARKVALRSHWPTLDLSSNGHPYVVWDETGEGGRPAGVWYSYSTNGGRNWAPATRVDTSKNTDLWPWLAVGDDGRVAIAWLEADRRLPDNDPETTGEHGWRLMAAQTLTGLGCRRSQRPGFRVAAATPKPIHRGTICNSGTACQAQGIDRRLGDYFTIEIDKSGRMWAGYSDTRRGGAVALPGFVRQTGGPRFVARARATS